VAPRVDDELVLDAVDARHRLGDLRAGVKAGRLSVAHEGIAVLAAGGALLAVMRAVLDGDARRNADINHAEGVLHLFGLPADDAAEVARRPLPAAVSGSWSAPAPGQPRLNAPLKPPRRCGLS
jgi:hypothetical protein